VTDHDPHIFATRVTITASGKSYDLADTNNAVTVMGPPVVGPPSHPTNTRLDTLVAVASVDSSDDFAYYLDPAASWTELTQGPANYYLLAGTVLYFSDDRSDTLRLEYVPVSAVDWTRQTAGDNEWMDELVNYHDIIAQLAYLHYAPMDSARSSEIEVLLQRRLSALNAYLTRGRSQGAADHMQFRV
jgi:hypothetical protein